METSFANGGQISAGHAEPWAKPSVRAEDPALARTRGRAAAVPAARRPGAVGMGPALPARMLPGPLRAQQPRARRAGRPTAANACARCAAHRHPLRRARARHPALRHQRRPISTRSRITPRRCARSACGARSSRPRECLALEPALHGLARPCRRRRLHARGRIRRRAQVHARACAACASEKGVRFQFGRRR